jgi:DNA mismatch endonuclease (patch repair protein)
MERSLREKLVNGSFGDVPASHSRRMAAIRATGARSTEKRIRALLARAGVRGWKLHPPGLPGKPDILFPAARLVLFVDGCYWHGCPRCGNVPRVNRPYWSAKLEGNRRRDERNNALLVEQGYRVLRVWEHELAEGSDWLTRLRALLAA